MTRSKLDKLRHDGALLLGREFYRLHGRRSPLLCNKDAVIQIGEEVTTSGSTYSEGFFPRGIHIGYIKQVHRDDSGLYQYAEIVPRATGGLLDYLFVVGSAVEAP